MMKLKQRRKSFSINIVSGGTFTIATHVTSLDGNRNRLYGELRKAVRLLSEVSFPLEVGESCDPIHGSKAIQNCSPQDF